jgi:hypothetical protein
MKRWDPERLTHSKSPSLLNGRKLAKAQAIQIQVQFCQVIITFISLFLCVCYWDLNSASHFLGRYSTMWVILLPSFLWYFRDRMSVCAWTSIILLFYASVITVMAGIYHHVHVCSIKKGSYKLFLPWLAWNCNSPAQCGMIGMFPSNQLLAEMGSNKHFAQASLQLWSS